MDWVAGRELSDIIEKTLSESGCNFRKVKSFLITDKISVQLT